MAAKPSIWQIHMWPKWLFELVTSQKSFRGNPILGSLVLNALGLHVHRLIAAHLISRLRALMLFHKMPAASRREFHRNGFCKMEGFVPADKIEAIKKELSAFDGEARQLVEGSTIIQRIPLDDVSLAELPATASVVTSKHYLNYLSYGATTGTYSPLNLQRLRHRSSGGDVDPQYTLHSDTFQPTMKSWLFLEDVTEKDGPFHYVPGSNRLSFRRLWWEYKQSLTAAKAVDGHTEDGSFRFTEQDLQKMKLPGAVPMTVPAGTLLVVNTHGIHNRGPAEAGGSRLEIWTGNRPNPFVPFPLPGFAALRRRKNARRRAAWARMDKRCAETGTENQFPKTTAAFVAKA